MRLKSVELIETHGTDLSIANAARVSLNKWHDHFISDDAAAALATSEQAFYAIEERDWQQLPWWGKLFVQKPRVQPTEASDERLLRYLAHAGHQSPFSHAGLSLRITAPIFVARQLLRSQIGLVTNEISRRYVNLPPTFWQPETWRQAVAGVKQGSGSPLPTWRHGLSCVLYGAATGVCALAYRGLMALGVCNEQARAVLPQAMHTTWIWTGSISAFHRVCALRLHPDAQQETRVIAEQIDAIACQEFPSAWAALKSAARY